SVKSDVPGTINVVSRDTYTVNDDVTSKRQCIQQLDCGPVCGFASSVSFNEPGVLGHQQCSTRQAECRPGSNVSLPELPGCPCVLENSESSVRKLVAKCVATGGGSPVSNIGSDSVKSDVPDTINVVSRDTYTVNDDVTSKRQCIQQSDCGP
ncbi:hypothetical protein Tco_0995725, partial [Tanacetum coccineum]